MLTSCVIKRQDRSKILKSYHLLPFPNFLLNASELGFLEHKLILPFHYSIHFVILVCNAMCSKTEIYLKLAKFVKHAS